MKLTEILSDDAKAAFADALAFIRGLPAEVFANGAGTQVAANLQGAIDAEVTAVAGPTISAVALPFVNEGFDKAIAALKAQVADLEAQKAALAPAAR